MAVNWRSLWQELQKISLGWVIILGWIAVSLVVWGVVELIGWVKGVFS